MPTAPSSQLHVIRETSSSNQKSELHVLREVDSNGVSTATVLELRVRNHPGTMSHVTGLFARRAFNLDAIVCVPVGDGSTSRILLLVSDEPRLEQVERQLTKLYDVLSIRHRPDLGAAYFARLGDDGPRST